MKMLYVSGDDFAALEFQNYFKGQTIASIIERFIDNDEEYDGDFVMELYEFGDVDGEFIHFVRNQIQDYDQSKDCNFYFEDQTV